MRLTLEGLEGISLESTQKKVRRKAVAASCTKEDCLELKKIELAKLQKRVAAEAVKDAIWD